MFELFWLPAIAALLSAGAVLILRPLATRGGLLDHPGGRKRHEGSTPLVGGIAILIAVWVSTAMFVRGYDQYTPLYIGLTLLALVGLFDDLNGIPPLSKLAFQFTAAILMTSWGEVYLHSLGDLLNKRDVILHAWGIPLTLLAVLAVVNAINMTDGMDGLAGGLSFIVFGWFAWLANDIGNPGAYRICLLVCGAIAGFLLFNMPSPLRRRLVFLGDAGSLLLGYGISWFSVELSQKEYNPAGHVPPAVMLWVVGLILIDLLAVVLRRAIQGKNPLAADRTHLHHLLLRAGLDSKQAVWFLLVGNFLLGLIGVIAWKQGVPESILFVAFLLLTGIHLLIMQRAWVVIRWIRRLRSR
ncbi:undecaprenyl/decaprenyl-phosphate alpha-N-acetylglucosaminyl 1-phosphate transferase [Cupriavidus sp. KK10]|jgi:UDP-GlcNAc:undecaprenyl-phosphate GlcNAc-1-phosphate transferase|uniref:undecaprenyl/decaprenyl-phosphate alpha-N-acetylglucosaminyl 1-phosphate transferase n=1 Tax=Cupriavidus TaxID=106589 RepID=UPI001BA5A09E|nr:undecaprenyl/decaprenyl-phosphate alpha-N-acetylglucosaminyl 1-phosphate transferase [Cupriavidus sp. KK10]QUN27596.1 undecaprenyl/decaprenyl-phosphate alpha-N-acetylglucosaminyl 1-phosphate transferase [Cupriavidus sp. KK10]